MKFLVEVPHGEQMPRWYGVAFHDYLVDTTYCAPIPFNLAIAAYKGVAFWLAVRFKSSWPHAMLPNRYYEFNVGYMAGYNDCKKGLPPRGGTQVR